MSYPSVTYTYSDSSTSIIRASELNQNYTDIVEGLTTGEKDINCKDMTCKDLTVSGSVSVGVSDSTVSIGVGSINISEYTGLNLPTVGIGTTGGISTVQVSSGIIYPTSSIHYVESEDGTTETLNAIDPIIVGDYPGYMLILMAADGHTITVADNASSEVDINAIWCGGGSRVLTGADTITLIKYDNIWRMLYYADN